MPPSTPEDDTAAPLAALIVDANRLAGRLLAEKMQHAGIAAEVLPGFEAASETASSSESVILWSFNWQYQASELAELRRWSPKLRVLVLGAACSRAAQAQLLLAGARGFVDQAEPFDRLLAALARVARGLRHFSDDVLSDAIDQLRQTPQLASSKPLTERERQIVAQIVRGRSNREIAAVLNVTESTIKSHLQAIFAKMGVSNRLALAMQVLHDPAALQGQARRRPSAAAPAAARSRVAP